MMFKGQKIFNASFDIYAKNYHSARPSYPQQLFIDLQDICGLTPESSILELGAGSGIATRELGKFGCRVVGIEPGANLVSIAKEQTADQCNVEVLEATFENLETKEKFDAVTAFTMFHWLKDDDKYSKLVDLLKDDGNLVIVWNSFFQSQDPVVAEINALYSRILSEVYETSSGVNEAVLAKLRNREIELMQNEHFVVYDLRRYVVVYHYDSETYPNLLNTFPKIINLEDIKRQEFLSQVADVVKRHGTISVPIMTTLLVCKKRGFFLSAMATTT